MKRLVLSFFVSFFLVVSTSHSAPHIEKGNLIRDSEIESFLKDIMAPLFQTAGLNPSDLNLYIIANPQINAAASIDHSIFMNTGLLIKADSLDQVIGVLAHETGHIALGHVFRTMDAIQNASILAMASMVLGAAISIASGSMDALAASMIGGYSMAMGSFFHYSRGQEASADQAGLRYLRQLNWTNKGLISFMQKLAQEEYRPVDRQTAYMRTHPLSSDRVKTLVATASKYPDGNQVPKRLEQKFHRIRAKLLAFLQPADTTLLQHPASNKSLISSYARAIAFFKKGQLLESMNALNALLRETPNDPFLHELKGQIYFDLGNVQEAFKSYQTAVKLRPKDPLIRITYVHVALEAKTVPLKHLIKDLFFVLDHEPKNPEAWYFLAVTYGKLGRKDLAALALAEKELTLFNVERAMVQAKKAKALTTSKQAKMRATDIIHMIETQKKS